MSLHSDSFTQHVSISAPSAVDLPNTDFTIACLVRIPPPPYSFIWAAYQPNDFSRLNMYFDGDFWYDFDHFDANLSTTERWMWIVVTKSSATEAPRVHAADYSETGSLTWIHGDFDTTEGTYLDIDRFCLGDEFGNGFKGDIAVLTAFYANYSDSTVAASFLRSSADILAQAPVFFCHWPSSMTLSDPFVDLAGGGEEIDGSRLGTWSLSADPPGFNFSLGRSGKPKVYNGSSWDQHQAKVWNGTTWVNHPMKGYNGSSFVASK